MRGAKRITIAIVTRSLDADDHARCLEDRGRSRAVREAEAIDAIVGDDRDDLGAAHGLDHDFRIDRAFRDRRNGARDAVAGRHLLLSTSTITITDDAFTSANAFEPAARPSEAALPW